MGGTPLFRLADKDGCRWVPDRGQDTSVLANGDLLPTVTQGDLAAVGHGAALNLANAWAGELERVWPRLTTKP